MTVLGARPQFVKAGALSRAYAAVGLEELIVHTGQHYDAGMSDIFFDELEIPPPWRHLGIGSHSAPVQTGRMLEALEEALRAADPDVVVVPGDTNSTLAGALAAAQLGLPVAHVEAGLRSFNRSMPEERNRILTDHLADALYAPSQRAVQWLTAEGLVQGVELVGDVMRDVLEWQLARRNDRVREPNGSTPMKLIVATIHRPSNTDDPERLRAILAALEELGAEGLNVVLPLHPRTHARLRGWSPTAVRVVDPLSHRELLELVRSARAVVTDSGGLQKEAYWLGVPCVTLRAETEWVETVYEGWNALVDADTDALVAAVREPVSGFGSRGAYGPPGASRRIAASLAERFAA